MTKKSILIVSTLALFAAGCAVTRKADVTQRPHREYAVEMPNGTVVAPTNFVILPGTNDVPWSLWDFLWGRKPHSIACMSDEPLDKYTGSGKFLLSDPAFAALSSQHTNQTVLGGQSAFSVGSATVTVSTNGIAAVGTAGSQIINSIGSAVGSVAGTAAKTAVGVPSVPPAK